ncbi:MAG: hypothetical protein BJ554DRAFT_835 [Olpidium bornovanus]|uniref:Uncharacterized protein n=1 Tax=Olpidium bornovanus TaxID=278681 RepID=A0A8H7ZSM5_9FUNG|nr:MAG: hypothetical protein BJ554DRAFT_835 [Olpidium bornovanus]
MPLPLPPTSAPYKQQGNFTHRYRISFTQPQFDTSPISSAEIQHMLSASFPPTAWFPLFHIPRSSVLSQRTAAPGRTGGGGSSVPPQKNEFFFLGLPGLFFPFPQSGVTGFKNSARLY